MNSLFLKLFIAFWLTTLAAMFGSQQLGHFLDSNRPPQASFRDHHRHAARLVRESQRVLLRTAGDQQWMQWLHGLPEGMNWVLITADGRHIERKPGTLDSVSAAIDKLDSQQLRIRAMSNGKLILGRQLFMPRREPYGKLLIVMPRPHPLVVELLHRYFWLRLIIAMAASGLVCWLLARRYSRPIEQLRNASRELSEGKLDTRIAVPPGNDELSALAADFNHMAEELQRAQQSQQQLVHDISHELRTPLARIQAALALAQRGDQPASALGRIERECTQLNEMIGQLLLQRSLNDAPLALDDTIDLHALLASLIADNQLEAQHQGVALRVTEESQSTWLRCAIGDLHRALENILRNAIRHSPADSSIDISVTHTAGNIQIHIDDCGPGVPAAQLQDIFTAFFRVEQARDRDSGGVGLGLAIAQRAIRAHGGQVSAENTGRGLRVTVSLPDSLLANPA